MKKQNHFLLVSNYKNQDRMDLENAKHFKDSHSSPTGMDPNYHYLICSDASLYLRRDAPIADMGLGLGDVKEWTQPIELAFYVYDTTNSYPSERNTDKYINYVLNLDAEKAKHLYVMGDGFRIVRVPKEMAEYTRIKVRSTGYLGYESEFYVKVDYSKAIIDLTKKTLEDPTPEKIEHLKQKIAFFESVKVEEVHTLFSKECCSDDE